ncbi:hypothetical protein Tcan_14218 [Toxocara canis]|uniref:Insulin-like domain-containing protein n=1 Tax=Toxocara canis TaxID=6265 RepID=A0A0B2VNJ8_TOXCA|nr:hypothetical protein Tcan_14218 [Toxocara canis]
MRATEAIHAPNVGVLKMCPPGGETFAIAWQLTCGMRKKRQAPSQEERGEQRTKRSDDYRPLSLTEMMHYCCRFGCTFRDLLPYCDPFGGWDS